MQKRGAGKTIGSTDVPASRLGATSELNKSFTQRRSGAAAKSEREHSRKGAKYAKQESGQIRFSSAAPPRRCEIIILTTRGCELRVRVDRVS
jgi:hypothetical protein